MSKGPKNTGTIILFLLTGFLFLVTLKESCGQSKPPQPKSIGSDIELPGPGPIASPVGKEDVPVDSQKANITVSSKDVEKSKDKDKGVVDQELMKLELVLSKPLVFFVWSPPDEEGYIFDRYE